MAVLRLLCALYLVAAVSAGPVPPTFDPKVLGKSLGYQQGLIGVAYADSSTGYYLGSPSLLTLPGGVMLASHDTFQGWGTPPEGAPTTYVYRSNDGGRNWAPVGQAPNQYWSTLFTVGGRVYLLGTSGSQKPAGVSISMSQDNGATWKSALLFSPPADCAYHTGSVPVLQHDGSVWRGFERWCGQLQWPKSYQPLFVYASAGADLLNPASWKMADAAPSFSQDQIPAWMPDPVSWGGMLEGNIVAAPSGNLALLLRCRVFEDPIPEGRSYTLNHACLYRVTLPPGGAPPQLQWEGFISMPGGGNKFSVKRDPATKLYLALTNPSIERWRQFDQRNTVTLVYSANLVDWRIARTVLVPNDNLGWDQSLQKTGYMYADWQFSGEDIVALFRTAYNGANNYHDTNWMAFKRIKKYRRFLPKNPLLPL